MELQLANFKNKKKIKKRNMKTRPFKEDIKDL